MTTAASQPTRGLVPEWSFADRLRKVRKDVTGLGQREFAAKLDVGWQAYAQWEAGRRPRDIVAIARRVEVLTGVSASWMLGLDTPSRSVVSGALLDTNVAGKDAVVLPFAPRRPGTVRGLSTMVRNVS